VECARDLVPELSAFGAKWVVIGIGTTARARDFCRENAIDENIVYADETNATYDKLKFRKGVKATFFTRSTPEAIAKRVAEDGASTLTSVLKRWKPWLPPKQEQGLQQGGTIVFSGKDTVYAWYDESTGAHAPVEDVIEAARRATEARAKT